MLILGNDTVIDFPILDADAHVIEPPDTWQPRMPAKLRDRAPRVLRMEDGGDAWQFDENKPLHRLGLIAMAGKSFLQFNNSGVSYHQVRPGGFEQAQHVILLRREFEIGEEFILVGAQTVVGSPEVEKRLLLGRIEALAFFLDLLLLHGHGTQGYICSNKTC